MKTLSLSLILVLSFLLSNAQENTLAGFEIQNNKQLRFVRDMGVGWNLGNTLDSKGKDETAWANPKATKELVNVIKEKGFNTLRVPVTWQYHIGAGPHYQIESAWLNRVEEVVNYGLDNKMYVIINIHHDEEWVIATYKECERVKQQLSKVWTQIAEHFKNYPDKLIFETLNEVRLKDTPEEWNGGSAESRDCLNQFHQVCVDAIRATGNRNKQRYLMISPYAASSIPNALNDFYLPDDKNLIVSIHNYYPWKLCLEKTRKNWGTEKDKMELDKEFDRLVAKYLSKGIPVVMGEWGTMNNENTQDRIRHAEYYSAACLKRGICPIWWDNGYPHEFAIIDRKNNEWLFPEIADAIIQSQIIFSTTK
ncbi:glycoside hydrolase family 5 protein [Carboxylicivirga sp. M1479]|uniref:glycoside hydrolase family 5 protein n=1 Tax=Carboxylicivirga sp. M1479 TaxID=2594476 RepID=UPI001177BF2D|nr:glycoside hydrolase family 5 protein [Carboxylicivirga sp. M1479]TRX71798.1 glycoside hydrolase family 5 protein [Carboxylicivirga sp. M1479]